MSLAFSDCSDWVKFGLEKDSWECPETNGSNAPFCQKDYELCAGHWCEEYKTCSAAQVNQPAHYTEYPKEVVDIIKFTLTEEQFKGWCIGNELKYRLRAGLKDPEKLYEDLDKAMKIRQWRK